MWLRAAESWWVLILLVEGCRCDTDVTKVGAETEIRCSYWRGSHKRPSFPLCIFWASSSSLDFLYLDSLGWCSWFRFCQSYSATWDLFSAHGTACCCGELVVSVFMSDSLLSLQLSRAFSLSHAGWAVLHIRTHCESHVWHLYVALAFGQWS